MDLNNRASNNRDSHIGDASSGEAGGARVGRPSTGDRSCDLLRLLARRSRSDAGRPAILGAEPVTWAEVNERVELAAGALAEHGVRPDGSVLLAVDGPAAGLVGVMAAARLGAVVTPISTAALGSVLADADRCARLVGAAVVLTDNPHLLPRDRGPLNGIVLDRGGATHLTAAAHVAPALRPSARSARAVVAYSRSLRTLGQRAVARQHHQLVAEGLAVALAFRIDNEDAILAVAGLDTPLGLAFGVLVPLVTGASVIDPEASAPATVVVAGADWFRVLAECRPTDLSLARVRWCLTGDAVPRDVAAALAERYGIGVRRTYGRLESGLALADLGSRSFHDPSSVGVALPTVRVRLVDADGHDCDDGAMGEVVVESRWLAHENDVVSGDRAERVRAGELYTGERGCFDDEGNLLLVGGRPAARQLPTPEPLAVQAVLAAHPAVAEVAVLTVSTPLGARVMKAVVVSAERCDRRELVAWCRLHLRESDLPTVIEFRRELPAFVMEDALDPTAQTGALVLPPSSAPAAGAGPNVLPAALPIDPLAARLTG